jgi:hypothetical protein
LDEKYWHIFYKQSFIDKYAEKFHRIIFNSEYEDIERKARKFSKLEGFPYAPKIYRVFPYKFHLDPLKEYDKGSNIDI